MHAHRLAEERSLALHRVIADAIENDASIVERALERVRKWKRDGVAHPFYVDSWERLLAGSSAELRRTLLNPSEEARALRQMTPFAGCVDPRTRWRIWREVRERLERSA